MSFFTEQDITSKQVIKVCFDISDFEEIQQVYDFLARKYMEIIESI